MKKIYMCFLVQCICIITVAQSYTSLSNPTLNFLYNNNIEVSQISNTENLVLFPLIVGNKQAEFKLIRNKKGLFALVDGTGQVYKATNLVDNMIAFTRLDSTKFFGNNFESISFSFNDVLINFGGYGFWHMNGHFCYFNKDHEWTIEKVNKEFRTIDKIFSYNPSTAKIYYIQFPRIEDHTIEIDTKTTIVEFDIVKKENKILGELDPKNDVSWRYQYINIPSMNGVLTYNSAEAYLYRFSNNEVLKLKNVNIRNILIGKEDAKIVSTFEYNGTLYYSYSNDTTLRTLPIDYKDFELLDYPIYEEGKLLNYHWVIILLSSIIIITGLWVFFKKKRKPSVQMPDEAPIYETDLSSNDFNDIEKNIINKLIEKSNNNSYFNVEEFNSYLGIKKKTIEIQKRVRTEAINRINHKFNVNFNQDTVFIERVRSKEDRRYFNYVINKENARTYLENL